MYEVRTKLQHMTNGTWHETIDGTLGPFETRAAAERALVGLCQAGKVTTAKIVKVADGETPCEKHGIEHSRCGCQ